MKTPLANLSLLGLLVAATVLGGLYLAADDLPPQPSTAPSPMRAESESRWVLGKGPRAISSKRFAPDPIEEEALPTRPGDGENPALMKTARWLERRHVLAQLDEDGRPAVTAEALLAFEKEAVDSQLLIAWLGLVANSGTPEVLACATRHMGSDDPVVRDAAVDALRAAPDGEAVEILGDRALEDKNVGVRARAVEVLAQRGGAIAMKKLSQVLQQETSSIVRLVAVTSLADRRADPRVAELLTRTWNNDTDPQIREAARKSFGG